MKKKLIYSGMIAAMLMSATIKTDAQNWVLGGNSPTKHDTLGNKTAFDLRFTTTNKIRMTIKTGTGRVGIGNGTNTPNAKLDVWSGTTANDTIPVINALVKRTQASDIIGVQGTSQPNPGYGIGVAGTGNFIGVFGSGGSDGVRGVGFNGTVGFGIAADTLLATGEIHGAHGQTSLGHWAIGTAGFATDGAINYGALGFSPDTSATSVDFGVFCIGDMGFTGKLFDVSDAKFKKDVNPLVKGVELLSKLNPTTYYFRTADYPNIGLSGRKQYGFVAQEVEKVFPELVKNSFIPPIYKNMDRNKELLSPEIPFKSVDYVGVIPIIVQAVNEQQNELKAKDAVIADLTTRLAALEAKVAGTSSAKLSSVNNMEGTLEQNNPNPFNQSTQIRYSVPSKYNSAQIIITSMDGKSIRNYAISGTGKGQITLNANELSVGSYTYSLNVDGKIVDTKTLVLTK